MKVRDASTVAEKQETWTSCRSCTDSLVIVQTWATNKNKRKEKQNTVS